MCSSHRPLDLTRGGSPWRTPTARVMVVVFAGVAMLDTALALVALRA